MIPFSKPGKRLSNGESCRELEEKVAKISGADYAISCSSCTQGLALALGSAGARDDCWTASFTWPSTAIAANMTGAKVWMRDIEREKWVVPDYKVGGDERGGGFCIAVDTFGVQYQPESYVPIFYDRAHSLGVRFKTLGIASVLSFSPSKIITAGEGGMILTNKEKFAKTFIAGRDIICRMPESCAVMALADLQHLNDILEWKKDTYYYYKASFPQFQFQEGEGNHQVIGMLMDSKEQRDKVVREWKDLIEFKTYYEPLHLRNPASPPLRVTEEIYDRILCLPSWYKVDRETIVQSIRKAVEE